MKLLTYASTGATRVGILRGDRIVDIGEASGGTLPSTVRALLAMGPGALSRAAALGDRGFPASSVVAGPALPDPLSVRDFYAFERHVQDARRNRGLEMVPEWYEIPVFYFSNALAVRGPGAPIWAPPGSGKLDFELEVGVVIGTAGIDIEPGRAFDHVAGLVVLNDWSARDLQVVEMRVGLGPAKGKDFALGIGPWLVTMDELQDRVRGEAIDLAMVARLNGREVARGNLADLYHSIPRLLAQASRGVELHPGELLGTGTVGGGCLFEGGADATFLEPGDVVELEVERLGVLANPVVAPPL
ncbi:MAG: fumarylacetoacetate hydrolase family protein [Candidatus Dormibacteria bacterium]